jgi:hypothetical protein
VAYCKLISMPIKHLHNVTLNKKIKTSWLSTNIQFPVLIKLFIHGTTSYMYSCHAVLRQLYTKI